MNSKARRGNGLSRYFRILRCDSCSTGWPSGSQSRRRPDDSGPNTLHDFWGIGILRVWILGFWFCRVWKTSYDPPAYGFRGKIVSGGTIDIPGCGLWFACSAVRPRSARRQVSLPGANCPRWLLVAIFEYFLKLKRFKEFQWNTVTRLSFKVRG